jgi:hypothetical protein
LLILLIAWAQGDIVEAQGDIVEAQGDIVDFVDCLFLVNNINSVPLDPASPSTQ